MVIIDRWAEDDEIVYGEFAKGEGYKKAKEIVKSTRHRLPAAYFTSSIGAIFLLHLKL